MDSRVNIPPLLFELARAFNRRGYEFYFVGGYVRDTMMNRPTNDVDATTNARPNDIKTTLREELGERLYAMYTVGEKYGTIGLKLRGMDIEITTYRTEQYTEGSRHPEVKFGDSLYEDLSRRDFTINAVACDGEGHISDPFAGVSDMRDGIIRSVGKPYERIREDPLRMLRAVRFACTFGFEINTGLGISMQVDSSSIQDISFERVRDELSKMLLLDRPSRAIRIMERTGLLKYFLREVSRLVAIEQISEFHYEDAFDHTMRVLDNSMPILSQRLAALLHDTGKFNTLEYVNDPVERTIFHGHEQESARLSHRALHRLRYPNEMVRKVTHIVRNHMRPLALYNEMDAGRKPTRKAVRRFIAKCKLDNIVSVEDVLELNYADMLGHKEPVIDNYYALENLVKDVRAEVESQPDEAQSPLDGNEIMAIGSGKPGPWIGATKAHLTNLVIDGIIEEGDKDGAREAVKKFWNLTG